MTDVVTGDIMTFDPNLQVPYSQTWTAGWQRKLTSDIAVEARYVGTRSDSGSWQTYDYNELNIVENGFLNEFRLAQANLQANIAAGRGSHVPLLRAGTGTSPLPIFLAYFTGRNRSPTTGALHAAQLGPARTFATRSRRRNPDPFDARPTALDADAGAPRRTRSNAGLPANFLVANPDLARRRRGHRQRRRHAATTRCSSSCASGCRTACSSTPTTCSGKRSYESTRSAAA